MRPFVHQTIISDAAMADSLGSWGMYSWRVNSNKSSTTTSNLASALIVCSSWGHVSWGNLIFGSDTGDTAYNDLCLQVLCAPSCVLTRNVISRWKFMGMIQIWVAMGRRLWSCWKWFLGTRIMSVSRCAKTQTKWYGYQRTWDDHPSRNIGAITNLHHGDAIKQCRKYSFDLILTLVFTSIFMFFLGGNCQATPVKPFQNKFGNCSGSLCAVHLPSTRQRWYVAGWLPQCSLSTLVATESWQKLVDKIVLQL